MANTPKKIKDPTEAALSAIQDALSARDAAAEAQAASPPAPPVSAAEELQWPGVSSAPEADGHQAEGQIFSRRAAVKRFAGLPPLGRLRKHVALLESH